MIDENWLALRDQRLVDGKAGRAALVVCEQSLTPLRPGHSQESGQDNRNHRDHVQRWRVNI